ncbi:hypothetical protein EB118_07220 [bacterium]|nr:hypothetical protein [bacterium]NDC94443.1 hypothetical protein [bacterium]NDD84016.1 hypothetical protein [bacterium]NDG29872.1 hypothetical protein [bacterium]
MKLITLYFAFVFCVFGVDAWIPAVTTRYYDCCKPSCGWSNKAPVTRPVYSCYRNGSNIKSPDIVSGCEGGEAFNCDAQTPFVINSQVSYGFAAAKIPGQTEREWCCSCWELAFTNGPVKGKRMIVQITNTGGDLGASHFDIAIPGGGQGAFAGCDAQYTQYASGERYGGIRSRIECTRLPPTQRPGCLWRFDWFKNADNPGVMARPVACPQQLTNLSGCKRVD